MASGVSFLTDTINYNYEEIKIEEFENYSALANYHLHQEDSTKAGWSSL